MTTPPTVPATPQTNPTPPTNWNQEPPLDHAELCARVRFSLDDPPAPSASWLKQAQGRAREANDKVRMQNLRVTQAIMPDLFQAVKDVSKRLLLQVEPEVIVMPDAEPNAFVRLPGVPGEPPFIVLHSGLIELLSLDELSSIIGHELGHSGCKHASNNDDENWAAGSFHLENSRASEISADRIGILAAPSVEAALTAEIKMKTGLSSRHLKVDVSAILAGFPGKSEEFDRRWEASTHPDLSLRFWAQAVFAETDLFRSLKGLEGGRPFAEVEREIEQRFLSVGAGVAFRAASDVLHEAIAWMGVLVVSDDGIVDDKEKAALIQYVGVIWAEDACDYARRHGLKAVERRAKEVIKPLAATGSRTRKRLEQSLRCLARDAGSEQKFEKLAALLKDFLNGD